jgi:hypothetical protein
VLREQTTPGVNLTLLLNGYWLIPARAPLDEATVAAAVGEMTSSLGTRAEDPKLLLLPAAAPYEPLRAAGMSKLADAHFYCLTRGLPTGRLPRIRSE